MPPASFVGAAVPTTSRSATITFLVPSATKPGDTLLFFAWSGETNDSNLVTATLASGWALLSRVDTASRQMAVLLRRQATLDEPAQHTFSMIATGGGFPMLGIGQVYRGLDNSAAIVAAQVLDIVAATNAFACPSLVLTTYSDLYLGIAADHMSPGTATPPAGATERVDASPVNDGGGHLEVFDLQREATGATGTQTITLSVASTGIAVAYALKTLPPPLAPAITPDVAGAIGLVRIGV